MTALDLSFLEPLEEAARKVMDGTWPPRKYDTLATANMSLALRRQIESAFAKASTPAVAGADVREGTITPEIQAWAESIFDSANAIEELARLKDALSTVIAERDEVRRQNDGFAQRCLSLEIQRRDAESQVEHLKKALEEARCPRPCNDRPDTETVGTCNEAGLCGCGARSALTQAERTR